MRRLANLFRGVALALLICALGSFVATLGFPRIAWALGGAPVSYQFFTTDGNWETRTVSDYTSLDANTVEWNDVWYVATGDVVINQRVVAKGSVHLVLSDGCSLTINGGIQVSEGNSLTIYGQSAGTGALAAYASYFDVGTGSCAGIGGDTNGTCGTVTIYGGHVTAKGGDVGYASGAGAGIGGGGSNTVPAGHGGSVTVFGGSISATGGSGIVYGSSAGGAGIGGGGSMRSVAGDGGTVLVLGGELSAVGGDTPPYGNASSIGAGGVRFATPGAPGSGIKPAEDGTYAVYGDLSLPGDIAIPEGTVVVLPEGTSLTVPKGVKLTNKGMIVLQGGTFTNNGVLKGNQPVYPSQVSVSISDSEGNPISDNTTTYGDIITFTATIQQASGSATTLNAGAGTVDFYLGNADGETKLNTNNISIEPGSEGAYTASMSLELMGDNWLPISSPFTITADFSGASSESAYGLAPAEGSSELTVVKQEQATPDIDFASTGVWINTIDVTYAYSSEDEERTHGKVEFAIVKGVDAAVPGDASAWHDDGIEDQYPSRCRYVFSNLELDTAYSLFIRFGETDTLNSSEAISVGSLYTFYPSPSAHIDYAKEVLSGLAAGGEYEVTLQPSYDRSSHIADDQGFIAIDEGWMGREIILGRQRDGETASGWQTIDIPNRPAAPSTDNGSFSVLEPASTGGIGTVLPAEDIALEYRSDNKCDWLTLPAEGIELVAGESVELRLAATESSFASEIATLTMPDHTHVSAGAWLSDCEGHWHACVSSECDARLDSADHAYGAWETTVPASCVEQGEGSRTCSVCGYVETRPLSALSHSWGDWVTEKKPTYDTEGEAVRTCSLCGDKESRVIARLTHDAGGDRGDTAGPATGVIPSTGDMGTGAAVLAASAALGTLALGIVCRRRA